LTFDKAALDVSQVFLPGQAYVALSRLRSLDGLVLLSPLRMNGISNDADVMEYSESKADAGLLEASLEKDSRAFICNYLKNSFEWKELAQEWRNHKFSYQQDAEKSTKSPHHLWAKQQCDSIEALLVPARKFISQLDVLFAAEQFDIDHISGRINAAAEYFSEPLDNLVSEILWKLEEVKRMKKSKTFYNELLDLEELQTNAVLQLLKAQKLISTVVEGKEICKENLVSAEIKSYRSDKLALIQQEFRKQNVTLAGDEEQVDRYLSKKKAKTKEPKKNTVQETYELWLQKNTVKEIAGIRKLTIQTIYNHITKLIESETVQLSDVLPADRISDLKTAFHGYTSESLNGLKEKYGEKFTWDELRLFKASQHV
jgi:uncharacterized protein YpbB